MTKPNYFDLTCTVVSSFNINGITKFHIIIYDKKHNDLFLIPRNYLRYNMFAALTFMPIIL